MLCFLPFPSLPLFSWQPFAPSFICFSSPFVLKTELSLSCVVGKTASKLWNNFSHMVNYFHSPLPFMYCPSFSSLQWREEVFLQLLLPRYNSHLFSNFFNETCFLQVLAHFFIDFFFLFLIRIPKSSGWLFNLKQLQYKVNHEKS